MISREELADFREKHLSMEKEIDGLGAEQFPEIVRLAGTLNELMEGIDGIKEQEAKLHDPHVNERIRIMKKGIKLSKNVKYFEDNVVIEFGQGNIPEKTGKMFLEVTTAIKEGKMPVAKKKLEYFLEILSLHKRYEESKERMKNEERLLRREIHQAESLLAGLGWLEKQTIDQEKVRKCLEWQERIQELESLRQEYFASLSLRPAAELLKEGVLAESQFTGQKEKLMEINSFFSEYPEIGKHTPSQICELISASEKKLSYVCPETSKFRKAIGENKQVFETLHSLGRTGFLEPNPQDESAMGVYSSEVPGAKSHVERLRLLAPHQNDFEAEFQKRKEADEKRKELEGHTREKLEASLSEAKSLLGLLHSEKDALPGKKQAKKEGSLFSMVASLFKK